jgi:hypothetical protein
MNKRGAILVENIVFIVLNLIFLTILVMFLMRQGGGAVVMEQGYAKEIALMIDAAQPGMEIHFDMEDAKELAKKNGFEPDEIVKKQDNIITVKLSKDSGYSYSFFNDVDVSVFSDAVNTNAYVIKINGYGVKDE